MHIGLAKHSLAFVVSCQVMAPTRLTLCVCGRDVGNQSRVFCMPDKHSITNDTPNIKFLAFAQSPLFP